MPHVDCKHVKCHKILLDLQTKKYYLYTDTFWNASALTPPCFFKKNTHAKNLSQDDWLITPDLI